MPAPTRRSPTGFRQKTSLKPKHRFRWKLWILVFVGVCLLAVIGWTLTRHPRGFECLTEVNTVCPPAIQAAFQPLEETPLWRLESRTAELLLEAQKDPRFVKATFSFSPLQKVNVRVQIAQPLFPFTAENQSWQLLDNGRFLPADTATLPNVAFISLEQAQTLSQIEREELTHLYQRLRTFTPRIRKILVLTSTEVEVYPENTGKVLFTLTDVERQLATLQAFFRSTTMNQTYQVLDVRFSEVAVIKE